MLPSDSRQSAPVREPERESTGRSVETGTHVWPQVNADRRKKLGINRTLRVIPGIRRKVAETSAYTFLGNGSWQRRDFLKNGIRIHLALHRGAAPWAAAGPRPALARVFQIPEGARRRRPRAGSSPRGRPRKTCKRPAETVWNSDTLSQLLLGQPAPLGGVAPPKTRRGARGLYSTGVHLASPRSVTQPFQSLAVVIEPFRIVRPALHIHRQLASRVLVLFCGEVHPAELAQDLARAVLFVLVEHRLQTFESVFEPALLERDAAQLEVSVGLLRVDRDCAFELPDGFRIL